MSVTLSGAQPAPTPEEIASVESEIGARLPLDYLTFLRTGNACEPDHNIFDVGTYTQSSVRAFYALREVATVNGYALEQTGGAVVPIAYDDCGNNICIGIAERNVGEIYFLDHEIPGPESLTWLAPSLAIFLEMLRPFDPASIPMPEGEVVVWVGPAFLAEHD